MSFGPSPDLSGNVTAIALCVDCTGAAAKHPMQFQDYGGPSVFVGSFGGTCAFGGQNYPSAYPAGNPFTARTVAGAITYQADRDPDCK